MMRRIERILTLDAEELKDAVFAYLKEQDVNTGLNRCIEFNLARNDQISCTIKSIDDDSLRLKKY